MGTSGARKTSLMDGLEFDIYMVLIGLIMNKEKGNMVKVDRFDYIKRVVHGTC